MVLGVNEEEGGGYPPFGSNIIQGNRVGTDVTGTLALGNGDSGIEIENAIENTIGGGASGAGNLISGNGGSGILLTIDNPDYTLYPNSDASNFIEGNRIGTDQSGFKSLGNAADGVLIDFDLNQTIGGSTAAKGNTIAYNGLAGVAITGASSTGNAVLSNAIYSNAKLGIDLGGDGVTPDAPGGPRSWTR